MGHCRHKGGYWSRGCTVVTRGIFVIAVGVVVARGVIVIGCCCCNKGYFCHSRGRCCRKGAYCSKGVLL